MVHTRKFEARALTARAAVFADGEHFVTVESSAAATQLAALLTDAQQTDCAPEQIVYAVAKALSVSVAIREAC